jgi:spermidine/putrescine transport system ATP-binding protein
MTDLAVELCNITKIFSGERKTTTDVTAVNHVNLQIRSGEFFTLLGPSGCGKTTLLRLMAGFETATQGDIFIQGIRFNDIPPYQRPVNTVFQNYALFPHMTVEQNVAFGLDVKGVNAAERKQRVQDALEMVRLPDMARRKPTQLSGGQQQRVALARAIVNRPAVLLLDEPLGALDLKLRKSMQIELKHLQTQLGITFVYVTHDQEEALTMSDRIAVMNRGQVLQIDDPITIYEKPATCFVADFIGESNFLKGAVDNVGNGQVRVHLAGGPQMSLPLNGHPVSQGQAVTITVRPEKLDLQPLNGDAHKSDILKGTVADVVYLGTDTRYTVELPSKEAMVIRVQNVRGKNWQKFTVGEAVKIEWFSEDIRVLNG